MAIITEDYVSFETAKLLKEKGFTGFTMFSYSTRGTTMCGHWENEIDWLPKCTFQMAMKWLRKVHGYVIVIEPGLSEGKYVWTYKVILCRTRTMLLQHEDNIGSSTYEEVIEMALKYCLNLI